MKNVEQIKKNNKNIKQLGLGLALSVGSIGIGSGVIGYEVGTHTNTSNLSPQAIEQGLNSNARTIAGATIEVGYTIPVTAKQVSAEGAVQISNPLKLGPNLYGYFAPISQSGRVELKTLQYDKPLQKPQWGGYSEEYAHEVITPLSVVYDTYSNSANNITEKNYWVAMGNVSGNINTMYKIEPHVSSSERNIEIQEEAGQIATASVGEIVYTGK